MPTWLSWLLALGAFLVLAPLLGWLGHKHGRSIKGGAALASMMFGMGMLFDPPRRPPIEAAEEKMGGDESGDPPDPEVARPKPTDG